MSARLVLSRKGFDSGYGRMPSPVLPDGRLLSLPIPTAHDAFQMEHVAADDLDLDSLLADLSGGRHSLATRIHLDPDLDRSPELRLPGWRPSLGQTGTAQSHLASRKIGIGDVFLFFGWFREVERARGRWRYVPKAPNVHALFGWLEVGDVLPVVLERQRCLQTHPWIANHPHVSNPAHYSDPRNTLYVAARQSRFVPGHTGGGPFPMLIPELVLTAAGHSRSRWRLPAWFFPEDGRAPLSYHGRLDRWTREGDTCLLKSVAKGQEFVLDLAGYPEAADWLGGLVMRSAPKLR